MINLKSRRSKLLVAIVLLPLLGTGLFYAYLAIYTPDVICKSYLEDYPLSTWKTYTDRTSTIQLKYPPDWDTKDSEYGVNFYNERSQGDYQNIKANLSVSVPYDPKYLRPESKKVNINGEVAVLEPDYIPIPGNGPWLRELHFENQPVHFNFQANDKRTLESYNCVFDEIVLSMKLLK
jgi:hypothetical protein